MGKVQVPHTLLQENIFKLARNLSRYSSKYYIQMNNTQKYVESASATEMQIKLNKDTIQIR